MQNEIFKVEINNQIIEIDHTGYKLFSEQSKGAIEDLKEFLTDCINAGNHSGRVPYNNFECFFNWQILN